MVLHKHHLNDWIFLRSLHLVSKTDLSYESCALVTLDYICNNAARVISECVQVVCINLFIYAPYFPRLVLLTIPARICIICMYNLSHFTQPRLVLLMHAERMRN